LKYIIGIDSGATSTETFLATVQGQKVLSKKYRAINFNLHGFKETSNRLITIIKDLSRKTGLRNILAITAGISGARNEKDRKKLRQAITRATGLKNIKICTDTEIAFASVFELNDKNCGILIAGTGSILYYRNKTGKIIRTGGWGRLIGDEGSGFWIAREAIYRITRHYDGRQGKTLLSGILKKEFGIDSSNIILEVYHNKFEISALTKHVFRLAEKGDKISKLIIQQAARNLLDHLISLKNKKCSIALMGSLFSEEVLLEKYLRKLAKEKFYKVKFISIKQKPVWGAVKLAMSNVKRSNVK